MSNRQRVEIHWHDILSDSDWIDDAKVRAVKPVDVVTVGYIVEDTGAHVTVAHSMIESKDEKSSDYTSIPWGCIQKMWKLKRNGVYAE